MYFFHNSHAKVQIIFDICKYHQFISQILSFYFTNIINLFHDIIIFFGTYMSVDTYMIFLERGRKLIAAQFVGIVVIKKNNRPL